GSWPASSLPFIQAPGNQSTGSRSMKFIRNTRQKMVSDNGAISLLRPWKVSRTWPSTKPTTISTTVWNLPGTPAVALRAVYRKKTRNSPDNANPYSTLSMLMAMTLPSPTCHWRCCKWCWMYSVDPPPEADSALTFYPDTKVQNQWVRDQSDREPCQQRERRHAPNTRCDCEYQYHHRPLQAGAQHQPQ